MHNADIASFKSFPFLRDEFFLKLLAGMDVVDGMDFKEFLFNAQCTYYKCYIDGNFDVNVFLSAQSAAPIQCPFSRAKGSKNVRFIADESPLKAKLSFYFGGLVSVSSIGHFKQPNIQIVNESNLIVTARDVAVYTGQEYSIDLNGLSDELLMVCSESAVFKIMNPKGSMLAELCKVQQVFSASDLIFLLGRNKTRNIYCFAPDRLKEAVNLLVYAKIIGLSLSHALETLQKSTVPSRLEPYAEILSAEYIRENPDLFK